MPLAEVYRLAKRKLESNEKKSATCSTHLSSIACNDFSEVDVETGQIVMHDQPTRPRKNHIEDEVLTSGRSDYRIVDPLELYNHSEFFTDFPKVSGNEVDTNSEAVHKGRSGNHTIDDSHPTSLQENTKVTSGGYESKMVRSKELCPLLSWPCQASNPALRSRVSSVTNPGTSNRSPKNDICNDLIQNQSCSLVYPSMKKQKQDTTTPLLNFTYFSRPVALVRASLESIGATAISPSIIDRKLDTNKESAVNSCEEMDMVANSQPVMVPATDELRLSSAKPSEEPNVSVPYCAASQEDAFQRDDFKNFARASRETRSVAYGEKANEPAVASVCSGNNVQSACDSIHNLKRKRSENDDSEYLSEDYEEEIGGVSSATTALVGSGCKRNRDAEMHNLSERRRRERINERMRALQELIPNCNKVDKASMLDEAIEYLKTLQLQLQLQLQMMSMGSRLCMPLMFPAAMQLMQAPHMHCFLPMGAGMNVLGAHLPGSPISGASNLQRMAGSNSSKLGIHGQGLPVLMPHLGSVSYSTMNPMMPANASSPEAPIGYEDSACFTINGFAPKRQQFSVAKQSVAANLDI